MGRKFPFHFLRLTKNDSPQLRATALRWVNPAPLAGASPSDDEFSLVGPGFRNDGHVDRNDPIGGVALAVGQLLFGLNAPLAIDGAAP